ncbi:sensor histidine kinase [Flavobacterium saccharophilum]|uniref:Two component regulator propeller n=1 Tax=Flavobacterium saccharophilum TaxID=29534 RepID=A0A1M7MKW0_9FLAO|nr:histidine kinase [Flavobacterium saccharophilum]SHM91503.1 Two component regulator propeller [Flavobacterium saccharophilum]
MLSLNKIFFQFFFLFISSFAFGQYFPSKNFTTSDGLPNNAVRSLFLDSKSILWIGTENGISRMENGTFTTIDESNGLGHNSCWDINEDADGNMWFASYGGGVSKFDGKKFTVFTIKDGLLANKTRKVFPFKNKVYVGTEQGVSIIDIKTNKLVTPKVPEHKEDFISLAFVEYDGVVYFTSTFEGLFKIDESTSNPRVVPIILHKNSYSLCLFGSTLYSGNEGHINKFDFNKISKGDKSSVNFGKSFVWQFAKDKRDTIFAAAWGVYTPDGGLYTIAKDKMTDVSSAYGIDSKVLLNVVYDQFNDILYVGSNNNGIYQVRLDKIINYNSFDGSSIIDFENFNNHKLILETRGVKILNSKQQVIKSISLEHFKKTEMNFYKKGKDILRKQSAESRDFELNFNIPTNQIEFYEIVKNQNSLWINSNIGIFEIDKNYVITSYLPKHSLKIGFTYNNKLIETITYAGVRIYEDLKTLKNNHYSKFEKNTPQYIVKILTNNNKTYLLSVFNGVYVYEKNQFKSYLADGIWKEKKFKHITKNNKGQLILAAEFGDVFVIDDSKFFKILKTISKKQIIGNTILFLESYKNYILIGTEKGINIYKDGIIRLIDKEQGLKDCRITTSQIFNSTLWLGTQKGFYTIDLNRLIAAQLTVSEIGISSIAINNTPLKPSEYKWFRYHSKQLISDYKHNSLSIDFVPKGHSFPNKLKFRYRLNENNRWSPYSEKTNLFLPYLPFGNYNLELEVFDMNAGKSRFFSILQIKILPPFWLSWWFITITIICLSGLMIYIFIRIKRKSNEKTIIQRRIAETKLEALLSQMNPHFTFNAMNAIQDFIISNDIDNSLLYISEFSKLIRKTLENSSKQKITIDEEIEYLEGYIMIENMRFDNRIDFEIQISPKVDTCFTKIPTMLLQPFVENVFVHAFNESSVAPQLIISFKMISETILECKITDNGLGIKASKKNKLHQSKGIQLTKERLSLLQELKDPIEITFTENNGTIVTILLLV